VTSQKTYVDRAEIRSADCLARVEYRARLCQAYFGPSQQRCVGRLIVSLWIKDNQPNNSVLYSELFQQLNFVTIVFVASTTRLVAVSSICFSSVIQKPDTKFSARANVAQRLGARTAREAPNDDFDGGYWGHSQKTKFLLD
jgi:hypothetical protein